MFFFMWKGLKDGPKFNPSSLKGKSETYRTSDNRQMNEFAVK